MKKINLSRRDFLKGALAGAASFAVTGVLSGCTSTTETQALETTAEKTTVSVQDAPVVPQVPTEEELLWGEAPLSVDEFNFAETIDCDIVIVGAGTAGMPAAVSAAEEGAHVVVLEKLPAGFGMRSYIGAIGTTTQKNAGVNISEKEIVEELLRYSSYRANADLIKLWARKSGEAIDWYTNLMKEGNMEVWLETDINKDAHLKEFSTCHMYYSTGDSSITETSVMAAKMEALGCDMRYNTPMVQLIQEGKKVTGAIAKDEDGNYLRVNAKRGVVLATGGYAANTDMMKILNEKDYLSCVMNYCDPASTGDGIRAAHHAGGQMDLAHTAMYFQRSCTKVGGVGGDYSTPGLWWMGSQPFLQVNQKGQRFANESLPYDYNLHQAAGQAGRVFISIFDANWQEDVTAFHTVGCSRIIPAAKLADGYQAVKWTFEIDMAASFTPALENGQLVQADSIPELAEKLGLDPDVLQATVNRYNDLCAQGEDTDYYKEAYRMRPVVKAPFYGITVGGQLLCTMDGMQINTDCQVLDEKHDPIEGLYAIGNDSGCYFADCYPELIVGAAAGRSITFAYLLGKALAKQA